MSTDLAPIMIHHPASLSEDELHRLMAWARQVGLEAPYAARWLGDYAAWELQRRSCGEREEPQTLDLIPSAWQDGDVGQGVAALTKIVSSARADGTIDSVLVGSAVALATLARERLEKR